MTLTELKVQCKEKGFLIREHLEYNLIDLMKIWKDWDGMTRRAQVSFEMAYIFNEDFIQFAFSELEHSYTQSLLPGTDVVIKTWLSPRETSHRHNVPYRRVLKDCHRGTNLSVKIKNRWYIRPIASQSACRVS